MSEAMPLVANVLQIMSGLFVLIVGMAVLVVVAMYIADRTQTSHAPKSKAHSFKCLCFILLFIICSCLSVA